MVIYFGNFSRKYHLAHSRYKMRKRVSIQTIQIPALTSAKVIKVEMVPVPPPWAIVSSSRIFGAPELFS